MPDCRAKNCKNRRKPNKSKKQLEWEASHGKISFHRIPKEPGLRKMWLDEMGLDDNNLSETESLCSLHFTENMFDRTSMNSTRLYPGAMPFNSLRKKEPPLNERKVVLNEGVTQQEKTVDYINNQEILMTEAEETAVTIEEDKYWIKKCLNVSSTVDVPSTLEETAVTIEEDKYSIKKCLNVSSAVEVSSTLKDAPTQKRYLKRDAVPSCNLPKAKDHKLPRETTTKETSPRTDPCYSIEIKTEVNPEILDPGTIVERDHCYTIPKYRVEQLLNDRFAIKEEPPEEQLEMKMEPPDTDETEFEFNHPELGTSPVDSAMNSELEESEIKFESVDLPDVDLCDHFHQTWDSPTSAIVHRGRSSQTDDKKSGTKFIDLLKTDRALNIMTGVPSHCVLQKIIDTVKLASPRFARATGLKLTIDDRIIMTLVKLKQGLSYGVLAIFFRCSSKKACKRIVLRTLDVLSDCLKFVIHWPRRDELSLRVPDDFRKFPNVRCIISRIEIAVRKSKNLTNCIAARSCYKRYHSVKFLTAVTPDAFVCFLSKPRDGQTSHKDLFEGSNVIGFLRKNDQVMTLKDFPIDDVCRKSNLQLVRSLYLQDNDKSLNLADPNNYRIRLNVNRRIRRFRIFRRKLTSSLCLRAERIITIICAIENLHRSTLNNSKTSFR